MNNIIELINVTKIYNGAVPTTALKNINISIEKGKTIAIIGQSGSGKSTMLNILGLLDEATAGDVIIGGKSIHRLTKDELANIRNKTLGFVFQFHYLLPEFTVYENIMMPYWISGKEGSESEKKRIMEIMNLVGIAEVRDKKPTKISGGQRQRTAIARALMNMPDIILADEPTGNLDSVNTEKVYDLFCKINKELGTTFVLITHDKSIAERAHRIIELKDGIVINDLINKKRHCG